MISGATLSAGTALGLAAPALGAAQTYYVGTLADDGTAAIDCTDPANSDCTLRQAISKANANSHEYDYVVFKAGLSGAVHLGTGLGEIQITDAVYVGSPPTSGISVISGDHQSRIFSIDTTHGYDYVTISRLKLEDGSTSGNGGAIRNEDGVLDIVDSRITGSHAGGNGGAIYNAGTDQIFYGARNRVSYSSVYGNSADGNGGGVAGQYTIGGIDNSTVAGNSASNGGAASSGSAVNSSLSVVSSSTISGNAATGSGGGLYAKKLAVINSIVANDSAASSPDLKADDFLRLDYSLVEAPPPSMTTGNNNILGSDPLLGPLQSHNGNSPTLRPTRYSPVVDQGKSYSYHDQTGYLRPQDNPYVANVPGADGADMGSVELLVSEGPGPAGATAPAISSSTPAPTPHRRCKKKRKGSRAHAKKCRKKHRPRAVDHPFQLGRVR